MIGILQYLAVSPLLLGALFLGSATTTNALSVPSNHHNVVRRLAKKNDLESVRPKRRVNINSKRGPTSSGKSCRIRQVGAQTASLSSAASSSASSSASVAASSGSASSVVSSSSAAVSSTVTNQAASSVYSSSSAPAVEASTTAWTSTDVAPTQAATSTAVVVPSPVTPVAGTGGWANSGSKMGLCWPNGDWADPSQSDYVGNYIGNTVSFLYDWHYTGCKKATDLGIEYVPMMWGAKDAHQGFVDAQAGWPKTTKHVLFFNEPNDPGQSNISPQDAVAFWRQYMSPLKNQGYMIGMAATTSAPSGLEWVMKFKDLCADCWAQVDFVPLHYYDVSTDHFKQYVTNYYNHVQKPLWITEYACQNFNGGAQCGWDDTMNFHYEMAAWFNAQGFVERYSPFGAMKDMQGVNEMNRLMDSGGGITPLGAWYAHSA